MADNKQDLKNATQIPSVTVYKQKSAETRSSPEKKKARLPENDANIISKKNYTFIA